MDIGGADAGRPQRRGRRRDDARRHAEIPRATDGGAAVRLARGAVSDRPQRDAERSSSAHGATKIAGRCRSSPVLIGASGCITKRLPPHGSTRRCEPSSTGSTATDDDRSGAQGGARASLVRDHPPVRGRQRTHRARHRRSWRWRARRRARSASTACPRKSGRSATPTTDILEATQKGRSRRNALDGMVLGMPRSCLGRGRRKPSPWFSGRRTSGRKMPICELNERQRDAVNRLLDGFEGKLHFVKMGERSKNARTTRRCATSTI